MITALCISLAFHPVSLAYVARAIFIDDDDDAPTPVQAVGASPTCHCNTPPIGRLGMYVLEEDRCDTCGGIRR